MAKKEGTSIMRKTFLKKTQINFNDTDLQHVIAYEIFSSGECYGRIKNMTHDVELFGEDREAAMRLLDKLYFPHVAPEDDNKVIFTDLNPEVVVEFEE